MVFHSWKALFCFRKRCLSQVAVFFPRVSYYIVLEQFPEKYAGRSSSVNRNENKTPVSLRTRRVIIAYTSELCLSLLPPVRVMACPHPPAHLHSPLTCSLSMFGRVSGSEWSHLNHSLPLEIILEFLSNKKWYLWLKVTMMFSVIFSLFQVWNHYN